MVVAKDFTCAPQGSLGKHVVAEFVGCDPTLLEEEAFLKTHASEACRVAGATVLGVHSHKFEPQGATVVVLLAESHLSIHTWPEYGYAAVDVYTCGSNLTPEAAVRYLARQLKPRRKSVLLLERGRYEKAAGRVKFLSKTVLCSEIPLESPGQSRGGEEERLQREDSFPLGAGSSGRIGSADGA